MSLAVSVSLAAFAAALYYINRKVHKIMATVTNLSDHLVAIESGVRDLADEIKALKDGGLISQAKLDELDAQTVKVLAAIDAAK